MSCCQPDTSRSSICDPCSAHGIQITYAAVQEAVTAGPHSEAYTTAAVRNAVCLVPQLLFRVHAKSWLKLMIAPLGGGLEALGRSITPVRGGCGFAADHAPVLAAAALW
jgi:hypothetical protein